MLNKKITLIAAGIACAVLAPATSQAGRSSYGFSFSTGGPMFAPAPVYVAPPPPPPVVYPAYYYPAYPAYYRPAPSFSFSYHGH